MREIEEKQRRINELPKHIGKIQETLVPVMKFLGLPKHQHPCEQTVPTLSDLT